MRWKITTFNGTNINDVTNYEAWFPLGDDSVIVPPETSITEVKRSEYWPKYANSVLTSKKLVIAMNLKGTFHSQFDTIKKLLDVIGQSMHTLVVEDLDGSGATYSREAKFVKFLKVQNSYIEFQLYSDDPVWKAVTESHVQWNITATGQTKALTIGGNMPAKPRLVITPTSAGGTGFAYKRWVPVYNVTTKAFTKYPFDLASAGLDTAAVVALAAKSVVINNVAGITDSATEIDYDGETGTFPTSGTAYMGTEQFTYTGKTATQLTGCVRGVNGTTAAAHADDVVIYSSNMMANGNDLRVYVDGMEAPRWLSGINTANTKVWFNLNLKPKQELTLKTQIAATGAITTIDINVTAANRTAMNALPASGMALIGTEAFTYTGKTNNYTTLTLTGVTRAVRGTSMALHAVNSVIRWIEHDIWIYYGNLSADTPEQTDDEKPMIELDHSTNTSWVYESFADKSAMRTGRWNPMVLANSNLKDPSRQSGYFFGDRGDDADPATDLGMQILAWMNGSVWASVSADIIWQIYNPAGFTTVTVTGEKYRSTATWPVARMQKSNIGQTYWGNWATIFTEATPGSAATWASLTSHSAVALGGTYNWLRFEFSGTQPATANAAAYFDIDDVTLVVDSTRIPVAAVGAEQNNYHLQGKITNNTSGEWIKLSEGMELNNAVTIDCVEKSVKYADGSNYIGGMSWSTTREGWLDLAPGITTLQFDDPGTAGVTIDIYWRNRIL